MLDLKEIAETEFAKLDEKRKELEKRGAALQIRLRNEENSVELLTECAQFATDSLFLNLELLELNNFVDRCLENQKEDNLVNNREMQA